MAQAITSLKKEKIYYDNLEPMIDQMMLKFPHLAHDILKELDNISMANCRNISKQWRNFIDDQKFQFIRKIQRYRGNMRKFKVQWNKVIAKTSVENSYVHLKRF